LCGLFNFLLYFSLLIRFCIVAKFSRDRDSCPGVMLEISMISFTAAIMETCFLKIA